KPCPNCALVIGLVPFFLSSHAARAEIRMSGIQGAQADRSPKRRGDFFDVFVPDATSAGLFQSVQNERWRERHAVQKHDVRASRFATRQRFPAKSNDLVEMSEFDIASLRSRPDR